MAKRRVVKLSKKEAKYRLKMEQGKTDNFKVEQKTFLESKEKITLSVPQVVPLRRLSDLMQIPVSNIIQVLFKNGVTVTINESIDFETAVLIGDELGFNIIHEVQEKNEKTVSIKKLKPRPPVVTIMGHVDHGKTKLLDAIRETNVVAKEAGGITQYISAYQVEVDFEGKKNTITFVDTPGHEAFSALRAHGANITDIVILVVAANEGVKQQTLEAISHAKAANVPIIVAINKVDLPDADLDKVKTQLSDNGLIAEEWGGNTPVIPVSAVTKKNLNELLEHILIVSSMQELKADYETNPVGTIIESHVESGIGPVATALVEQGVAKVGNFIAVGTTWGKIRLLKDWKGNAIKEGFPSMPITIAGLKSVPSFGDRFIGVDSEKELKGIISKGTPPQTIKSIQEASGAKHEYNVIIKADTVGSLQAIKSSFHDISKNNINIKIVSEGIGAITETDINLAQTSKSRIIGFNVNVQNNVDKLAAQYDINIYNYKVIYKLLDEIKADMESSIKPEFAEEEKGSMDIAKVFFQIQEEAIIGGKVDAGDFNVDDKIKIFRDNELIGAGKIKSIKIGPTAVEEVEKGKECGLQIIKKTDNIGFKIKEGDRIIAHRLININSKSN